MITYCAMAATASNPVRKPTEKASANTPSGASHNTQPMMTNIVSLTARNSPSSFSRGSAPIRVTANPNTMPNSTIGNMSPAVRAAKILDGTIPVSVSAVDGIGGTADGLAPAVKVAATPGSTGHSHRIASVAPTAKNTPATTKAVNQASDRAVSPPDDAASAAEATPVTSRASTSGMMVIFSALSHTAPMGSMTEAREGAMLLPDSSNSAPPTRPRTSPSKIRFVEDIAVFVAARGRCGKTSLPACRKPPGRLPT